MQRIKRSLKSVFFIVNNCAESFQATTLQFYQLPIQKPHSRKHFAGAAKTLENTFKQKSWLSVPLKLLRESETLK